VRFNQLPLALTTALRAAPTAPASAGSVRTIPYFSGAFTFKSTPYPYFMVGGDPLRGGETPREYRRDPAKFFLRRVARRGRNNVSIRVDPVLRKTLSSPDFVSRRTAPVLASLAMQYSARSFIT